MGEGEWGRERYRERERLNINVSPVSPISFLQTAFTALLRSSY